MEDAHTLRIGDLVRPTASTIEDVGEVVGMRDGSYVIVQWSGSNRSTHHRQSLEHVRTGAEDGLANRCCA